MNGLNNSRFGTTAVNSSPGLSFWTIFAILMAFGLPIFIHFQQGDWKYNYDRSANLAFFYLALGTFLWLLLIILFLKKFFLNVFIAKSQYQNLVRNGKRIKGRLEKVEISNRNNDGEDKLLSILFKNLANTELSFKLPIVDTKPELRRYEPGKEIGLLVSTDPKKPKIILEDSRVVVEKGLLKLLYSVLLVLILTPIGLLVYGYLYESQGNGWRYLAFWHPYIIAPIMGLFYMFFMVFMSSFFKQPKSTEYLLLYGKAAEATIMAVNETGLTVNNLHQLLINIEFQVNGKTIQVSVKKLNSILSLSSLAPGSKINVLYDANNPQIIELYD